MSHQLDLSTENRSWHRCEATLQVLWHHGQLGKSGSDRSGDRGMIHTGLIGSSGSFLISYQEGLNARLLTLGSGSRVAGQYRPWRTSFVWQTGSLLINSGRVPDRTSKLLTSCSCSSTWPRLIFSPRHPSAAAVALVPASIESPCSRHSKSEPADQQVRWPFDQSVGASIASCIWLLDAVLLTFVMLHRSVFWLTCRTTSRRLLSSSQVAV